MDENETLTVGRIRVELLYMGRNHSDNSLVISVPQQKVIYAADWLPVGELIWRNIFDSYIDEWFVGIDKVLALDWEKLIVGQWSGYPARVSKWPVTKAASSLRASSMTKV